MCTKISQIQQLFKQLKNVLEEHMTIDQKKSTDKLHSIYKDLIKNHKQLGLQDNLNNINLFFSSLKIQLYSLKKDILNNKKISLSDYQAFLWKNQYYHQHKDLFLYIQKKQIMNKITLPKRAITTHINSNQQIQQNILKMKQFSFCPLGYSINDIINFSLSILYQNSYCQKYFKTQTMNKLLIQIAKQYQIVSYHNFTHAFSVQLMLFQCIEKSNKLKTIFTPFQIFVTYISALAHDIGHYGTNSDFQVKKKSQIAKLYSNQSVLENMHVSKFCKMLRKYPQLDIISQIKDPVQRQRSKRLLIRLILGTDVSKHFENLSRLKSLQSKELQSLQLLQKQVIHENLFHACDIGNCCLQFGDFMNWALLLSYEFNSQYEMQLNLGLQVSVMFKYGGQKGFYRGQCGFVDVLAIPLWKTIGQVFEQLDILVLKIQNNRTQLQRLVDITNDQIQK